MEHSKNSLFGGTQKTKAELALFMAAMIWAVAVPASKVVMEEVKPFVFNAVRFSLASAFFLTFFTLNGGIRLPEKKDAWKIVWLSLLGQFTYQMFFITGLSNTSAGNTGLILGSMPVVTAFFSSVVMRIEKLRAPTWTGILLAFLGVGVIKASGGGLAGASVDGNAMVIIAAVAFGSYTALAKPLAGKYGGMNLTAWGVWISTPMLWIAALPGALNTEWTSISAASWFWTAYAGLLSIGVAYSIWFRGTVIVGPAHTSIYQNVASALTLLTAWAWLHETPAVLQITGGAAVVTGFWLTRFSKT